MLRTQPTVKYREPENATPITWPSERLRAHVLSTRTWCPGEIIRCLRCDVEVEEGDRLFGIRGSSSKRLRSRSCHQPLGLAHSLMATVENNESLPLHSRRQFCITWPAIGQPSDDNLMRPNAVAETGLVAINLLAFQEDKRTCVSQSCRFLQYRKICGFFCERKQPINRFYSVLKTRDFFPQKKQLVVRLRCLHMPS